MTTRKKATKKAATRKKATKRTTRKKRPPQNAPQKKTAKRAIKDPDRKGRRGYKPAVKLPWEDAFIESLEEVYNVPAACQAAGQARDDALIAAGEEPKGKPLPRSCPYQRANVSQEFRDRWDEVRKAWKDAFGEEDVNLELRTSAIRRAIYGTLNGVFHAGKRVGAKVEFETGLTIFMLKKLMPDVFGDDAGGAESQTAQEKANDIRDFLAAMHEQTFAEPPPGGAMSAEEAGGGGGT